MNECPNCKSDRFALIVEGIDIEENVVRELINSKKIILKESLELHTIEKWICHDCQTMWGQKK